MGSGGRHTLQKQRSWMSLKGSLTYWHGKLGIWERLNEIQNRHWREIIAAKLIWWRHGATESFGNSSMQQIGNWMNPSLQQIHDSGLQSTWFSVCWLLTPFWHQDISRSHTCQPSEILLWDFLASKHCQSECWNHVPAFSFSVNSYWNINCPPHSARHSAALDDHLSNIRINE